MSRITKLIRPHLTALKPYASARHEFQGEADVFLDANENPFDTGVNRYPDPLQQDVKERLASHRQVHPDQIFLGNGSDEAIDLLIRLFCEPGKDHIIICEPTYGMYRVSAAISNVGVKACRLTDAFQLDPNAIEQLIDQNSKILFLCSPNNPTGNLLDPRTMIDIIKKFPGIVVVDEAYIDFAIEGSMLTKIQQFENLVILQTFSKAWGLAGVRVGIAYARSSIINWMNKIKPPYNVNTLSQEAVLAAFDSLASVENNVEQLLAQKYLVAESLQSLPSVQKVYPSDANFLLVKLSAAREWYELLRDQGVIVRDRSNVPLCEDCLRITIGTPEENRRLLSILNTQPIISRSNQK